MRKVICFHNPEERNGYLSNWYLSNFAKDGIKFSSMEQYMMYKKAEQFDDLETAAKILETTNAGKIKSLGRCVQNYNDTIWSGIRQIVVYEGLLEKFRQNKELKQRLLETGQDILAECALQDKIWGIGLSINDNNCHDISKWQGQNLLGFTLMRVREILQEDERSWAE